MDIQETLAPLEAARANIESAVLAATRAEGVRQKHHRAIVRIVEEWGAREGVEVSELCFLVQEALRKGTA